MKQLKKIAAGLVVGFLALAPPGTLVFTAILAFGLLGKFWFVSAAVVSVISLAIYGFIQRDKLSENRYLKVFTRKFRK